MRHYTKPPPLGSTLRISLWVESKREPVSPLLPIPDTIKTALLQSTFSESNEVDPALVSLYVEQVPREAGSAGLYLPR